MRPRGNARLCPTKRRKRQRKRQGRIRLKVLRKQQSEADNDEAQPDDSGRKVPAERNWNPRREYPNDKVLYPNLGTPDYPHRLTAAEVARMWELDKSPRATMGRTRSNSI